MDVLWFFFKGINFPMKIFLPAARNNFNYFKRILFFFFILLNKSILNKFDIKIYLNTILWFLLRNNFHTIFHFKNQLNNIKRVFSCENSLLNNYFYLRIDQQELIIKEFSSGMSTKVSSRESNRYSGSYFVFILSVC